MKEEDGRRTMKKRGERSEERLRRTERKLKESEQWKARRHALRFLFPSLGESSRKNQERRIVLIY